MSNTQFTGPVLSGPIQFTGGTNTLGIDVANVGYTELVQAAALTQLGSIAAFNTLITIPAFSQIIAIDLLETVQWAASNVSIGTSVAATQLAAATAAGSSFLVNFVPSTAPQGVLWANVGSADVQIWALTSTGTGGSGILRVRYIQQFNTTTS